MNRDGFWRRSIGKSKKKKKDGDEESSDKRKSSSNFALALGETERVAADNRRLKQELEFERSRNNYHGNDFRFPPGPGCISSATQTESDSCECDNLSRKNQLLEIEVEDLKNKIRGLEHQLCHGQGGSDRRFREEKHIFEEVKDLKRQNESLQKGIQTLHADFLSAAAKSTLKKIDPTQGKDKIKSSPDRGQNTEVISGISPGRHHGESNGRSCTGDCKATLRQDGNGEGHLTEDRESYGELEDLMETLHEEWSYRLEHMENTLAREMRALYAATVKTETLPIPDGPEVLKMPHNIKEFGWKLQSYMVTTDKVRHLFRALNVNCPDVEKLTSKAGVSPREQFWCLLCFWVKENKENGRLATIDDLQEACRVTDIGILKYGCMPKEHRLLLEQLHSYIEEHLLPAVTLPYLRDKGLLDNSDVFHVTSQCTRLERCASLLNLLPLFGENALESFCEALIKSEQPHVEKKIREHLRPNDEPVVEETARSPLYSKSNQSKITDADKHIGPLGFGQHDIFKLLASILTSTNHVEAMLMDMSAGSNSSSLARSDRGRYDSVSWSRSEGRCSIDRGSNASTLPRPGILNSFGLESNGSYPDRTSADTGSCGSTLARPDRGSRSKASTLELTHTSSTGRYSSFAGKSGTGRIPPDLARYVLSDESRCEDGRSKGSGSGGAGIDTTV